MTHSSLPSLYNLILAETWFASYIGIEHNFQLLKQCEIIVSLLVFKCSKIYVMNMSIDLHFCINLGQNQVVTSRQSFKHLEEKKYYTKSRENRNKKL